MKKKKIINIRKSIATGAVALATLVAIGLGLHKDNSNDDKYLPSDEPSQSEFISESPVISDLPGDVTIDPEPSDSKYEEAKDPDVTPSREEETSNPSESQELSEVESGKPDNSKNPNQNGKPGSKPNLGVRPSNNPNGDSNISMPIETDSPVYPTWPNDIAYPTSEPTESVDPNETPEPTQSVDPSETPEPTQSVDPSETPEPTQSVVPSETPDHSHRFVKGKISIKNNSNGTHSTIRIDKCSVCAEIREVVLSTEKCNTKDYNKSTGKDVCSVCGYEQAHKHNFGKETLIGGYYVSVCEKCGEEKKRPYNPPVEEHKHNWSDWTITKEPTCTTPGEETRRCLASGCTVLTEQREIPALGHDYGETIWGEWTVVTEDGKTFEKRTGTQTCKRDSNHTNIVTETRPYNPPAHEHNWSEWAYKDENTEERECSVCHEKETQSHTLTVTYTFDKDNKHTVHTTCSTGNCVIQDKTEDCDIVEGELTEYVPVSGSNTTHHQIRTDSCSLCHQSFDTEVNLENCSFVYNKDTHMEECSTCGRTKEHTVHTERANSRVSHPIENSNINCYQWYYVCDDCEQEIPIGDPVPHNFTDYDEEFKEYFCDHCGKWYKLSQPTQTSTFIEQSQSEETTFVEPIQTEETATVNAITTGDVPPVELALDKIINDQASARDEVKQKGEAQLLEILSSDADDNLKDEVVNWLIEDMESAYNAIDLQAEAALNNLISGEGVNDTLNPMILTRTK